MAISAEEVLREIGPVQEILDAHDGVVTVIDTAGRKCHAVPGWRLRWVLFDSDDCHADLLCTHATGFGERCQCSSTGNYQNTCAPSSTRKWQTRQSMKAR